MEKLVSYELGTGASDAGEPPHVKLMREKELCDYESASDVGNLKWFPKGRLVRDLLADYVYNLVVIKEQCLLKLQFSMIWTTKLLMFIC